MLVVVVHVEHCYFFNIFLCNRVQFIDSAPSYKKPHTHTFRVQAWGSTILSGRSFLQVKLTFCHTGHKVVFQTGRSGWIDIVPLTNCAEIGKIFPIFLIQRCDPASFHRFIHLHSPRILQSIFVQHLPRVLTGMGHISLPDVLQIREDSIPEEYPFLL